MKRLILTLTLLTLILSGAITLALTVRSVFGVTDQSAFGKWVTNADGTPCEMPCLFGIRVGVTKFDEVESILKAHPLVTIKRKYDPQLGDPYASLGFDLLIRSHSSNALILKQNKDGQIKLMVFSRTYGNTEKTDLRSVLMLFGIPESVELSQLKYRKPWHEFFFDNRTVRVVANDQHTKCRFDLDAEIFQLTFITKNDNSEWFKQPDKNEPPVIVPWAGFSRRTYWERYYSQWGYSEVPCTP